MTCSRSSSSSRAAGLAVALALAACAGAPLPQPEALRARPIRRVVLLPVENLAAAPAPLKELAAAAERALAARGLEVVSGEPVAQWLARHRIRYTGSVDAEGAVSAREELGADGVVVTTLEAYRAGAPPWLSLTMRLVRAGGEPTVEWIDGYGRTGDDAPGLLDLGLVGDIAVLEGEAMAGLASSMADHLEGKTPSARPCPRSFRFGPVYEYRSTALAPGKSRSVAVVPFLNRTRRRGAGELAALAFLRQLRASGAFDPVEPGVVRKVMLDQRIVMEGGVSLETVRLLLGTLAADLVVGGEVLEYDEAGPPRVNVTATVLDRGSGEVVFQSLSHNRGDDWVFFFGAGEVATAHDLACRMVASVVAGMGGGTPATESALHLRR